MDARVETILRDYEARDERERAVWSRLPPEDIAKRMDEFLFCVGPATGSFLNLLVREAGARRILELGTAYGYSTLWLAEAARANEGRVISMELSQDKIDHAGLALERAGLREQVELRRGHALEMLAESGEEFDFVLLDLWKNLYIPCFDACLPILEPGAIVVADNMLYPPSVALHGHRYRRHVRSVGEVDSVLLPIGSGLYVSRYRAR